MGATQRCPKSVNYSQGRSRGSADTAGGRHLGRAPCPMDRPLLQGWLVLTVEMGAVGDPAWPHRVRFLRFLSRGLWRDARSSPCTTCVETFSGEPFFFHCISTTVSLPFQAAGIRLGLFTRRPSLFTAHRASFLAAPPASTSAERSHQTSSCAGLGPPSRLPARPHVHLRSLPEMRAPWVLRVCLAFLVCILMY